MARAQDEFEASAQLEADVWARITRIGQCWIWKGALNRQHEPPLPIHTFYNPRAAGSASRVFSVRRYLIELLSGPVKRNLFIRNICGCYRCVRPDHQRAVSPREWGIGVGRVPKAIKGEPCKRGHLDWKKSPSGWYCRICNSLSYYRRKQFKAQA